MHFDTRVHSSPSLPRNVRVTRDLIRLKAELRRDLSASTMRSANALINSNTPCSASFPSLQFDAAKITQGYY